MGFSGHLVFACSDGSLLRAPVFEGVDEELRDTVQAWPSRAGGWHTLQLEHGLWEDGDLPALVEWSGAPACVAVVSDSDLALVTGLRPDRTGWQAWLNLDAAAALLVEEPEDVDDMSEWLGTPGFDEAVRRKRAELEAEVPAAAEGALGWAAAAGVTPVAQQSRVEELLLSREVFVEELFGALLDELGFREA
ncbi:hypothetical protein RKD23_004613 [Streptomyces sp. SAI-170]|uniref:hypothetical protein n=1 Tax=Streptomyces sp. SAI-170 TaxID=3377729 RepID=UPI003C7E239B